MSPSDSEISHYVDEADRIKRQQTKEAEKEARKNRPKEFPPLGIESFRAYREMYPHPPTIIWIYGLLTCIAGFLASLLDNLFTNDRLIFASLAGIMIVYGILKGKIAPIVWYARHHTWRKYLPYTLNGWEAFGSTHLYESEYWRDVTISFATSTAEPEFTTALNAIMTIICKDIAKIYYQKAVGVLSRSDWTWDPHSRKLVGSANCQVLGLLVDFFRGPLTRVVKHFGATMTVTLVPKDDWYHVDIRRTRMP